MAISPPSDIVLDVAKAANPVKLQAAAEKLARIAAGGDAGTAANFAAVMDAARGGVTRTATTPGPDPSVVLANLKRHVTAAAQAASEHAATPMTASMKAYKGLEAVFLQTYVEAMLPRNEGFFGDASAGNVCKSFLAQQLATQLAKSGSIGLAKTLFAAHAPGTANVSTAAVAQQTLALSAAALAGAGAGLLAGSIRSRSST